jgi:uncharacterized protein
MRCWECLSFSSIGCPTAGWIVAIVLLIGVPRIIYKVAVPAVDATAQKALDRENDEASTRHFQAAKHGPTSELVRGNATEMLAAKMDFQFGVFSRGYQTFGLFLIGLWLGRQRVFENLDLHRPRFRKLFWWTLVPGLVVPVVGLAVAAVSVLGAPAPAADAQGRPDLLSWPFVLGLCVYEILNSLMVVFYVSAFVLLAGRPAWRERLLLFAPAGRTALSSYLLQTVAGAIVFFHFGLGLLGDVGNHLTLPLGAAVFAGLVFASRLWLSKFQYGPVEWLWRSATFLRVQAFRKAA